MPSPVNSPELWLKTWPRLNPDGHKYDRGHALIFGGAVMTGAARLAARAAQRMGAGLVTLASPPSALNIYAEALESVIVRAADSLSDWQNLLDDEKRNAVLIGSGMGTESGHRDFVIAVLRTKKTCVLDADALTIFADHPQTLFDALHPECVLTPHEGEFRRLFGDLIDYSRPKAARAAKAAELANCVVLLKGAETVIATPDGGIIVNNNAPPWLATAGAGDVLAGMILGLIAQKMPVFEAAAASAWCHGQIAADFGPGLIAEDLINGVPPLLKSLSGRSGVV